MGDRGGSTFSGELGVVVNGSGKQEARYGGECKGQKEDGRGGWDDCMAELLWGIWSAVGATTRTVI